MDFKCIKLNDSNNCKLLIARNIPKFIGYFGINNISNSIIILCLNNNYLISIYKLITNFHNFYIQNRKKYQYYNTNNKFYMIKNKYSLKKSFLITF